MRPKKYLSALILALFAAFVAFLCVKNTTEQQTKNDTLLIYSESHGSGEVVYRGAAIDEVWYSPWDTVPNSGNWIWEPEEAVYTAVDDTPLEVVLPRGSNRTITFTAGPDQGKVRVEINEDVLHLDLYNATLVSLGLAYDIPDTAPAEIPANVIPTPCVVVFLLVLAIALAPSKNADIHERGTARELWGDMLRTVCSFVIVWLHCSAGMMWEWTGGRISVMLVNCLTAFGVPCFFMVSGAYLLRKPRSLKDALCRRVPNMFLPVLFWGVVYLLLDGNWNIISYIKLLYTNQTVHLWFMYSLLGIYVLLPFLSKLYCSLSLEEKFVLLLPLFVIPTVLYDASLLLGINTPRYSFSAMWPDLGLFLMGAILWDLREQIQKKPWWMFCLTFLLGYGMTVAGTVYLSDFGANPNKGFISAIGSIGNTTMAASFAALLLSLEDSLQMLPDRLKAVIHAFGRSAVGIYFIHMIFVSGLNRNVFPQIPLSPNEGPTLLVFGIAIVYFTLCGVISICAGRVSRLSKLFQ